MFKFLSQRPSAQVAGTGYSLRTPGDCSPCEPRGRKTTPAPRCSPVRLPASRAAGETGTEACPALNTGSRQNTSSGSSSWTAPLPHAGDPGASCVPVRSHQGGGGSRVLQSPLLNRGKDYKACSLQWQESSGLDSSLGKAGSACELRSVCWSGCRGRREARPWAAVGTAVDGQGGKATRPSPRLARGRQSPTGFTTSL